jgi:hypothetical protein
MVDREEEIGPIFQDGFLKERYALVPVASGETAAKHLCGDVAQLGEHHVRNVRVGGSNPPISTIFLLP